MVLRAREGSKEAFAALVERTEPRIRSFLRRFNGNAQDCEDLAQETFVAAYRYLDSYDASYSPMTWLFTIARRLSMRRAGRRRVETVELFDDQIPADSSDDAATRLLEEERRAGLWTVAIESLGRERATVLWLFYVEELGVNEIAAALGRGRSWVKVTLHRARKRLANELPHLDDRPMDEGGPT